MNILIGKLQNAHQFKELLMLELLCTTQGMYYMYARCIHVQLLQNKYKCINFCTKLVCGLIYSHNVVKQENLKVVRLPMPADILGDLSSLIQYMFHSISAGIGNSLFN